MRQIFLITLLFCVSAYSAQTFELLLDPDMEGNIMGSCVIDEDGNIRTKIRNFTGDEPIYRYLTIDPSGNQIGEQIYLDTGFVHQGGDPIQVENDHFLFSGTRTDLAGNDTQGLLIKVDSNGNELWLQTYGGDEFDAIRELTIAPDGGYALFGVTRSEGVGSTDFWMVKTNEEGEVLWTKTYGTPQQEFLTDAVLLPDNQHYMLGGMNRNANDFDQLRKYLVKIDLNGEVIWEKQFSYNSFNTDFQDKENGAYFIPLENGNFYVAGSHQELVNGPFNLQSDLYLLDENGEILWEKIYNYVNPVSAISVFAIINRPILKNNGIYSSGTIANENGVREGFLMKLNTQGDSLWLRRFTGNPQIDTYFYDLNYSPDGHFVMSGTTFGTEAPINQDGYIVKVDSMGCLVPGCAVGFEEFRKENGYFKIGPNPAKERLNIYFTELPLSEQLSLAVYDLQGKAVLREENIRGDLTYMLDISHLTSGMYTVQLHNQNSILQTEKLVVE